MYFWSWLIQLNRSYKYNENITRTGISTWNGHISETVQNFEKMKKIRCNYFSILSLDRWFRNFPQCVFLPFFAHMGLFSVVFEVLEVDYFCPNMPPGSGKKRMGKKKICRHIKNELVPATFVYLIFKNFAWNDDVKSFFLEIVGTSWMGCGRVEWYWHMGMSNLTSLDPQLSKNIAYVGSFAHFSVQPFFTCILQLDQIHR